jgi:hypothetical protein
MQHITHQVDVMGPLRTHAYEYENQLRNQQITSWCTMDANKMLTDWNGYVD